MVDDEGSKMGASDADGRGVLGAGVPGTGVPGLGVLGAGVPGALLA